MAERFLPRLRQAVIAARDLDAVAADLTERLGLREPFHDPGVGYFGLKNAVFTLGDTFLEVVAPLNEDTAASRLIARRGGDCGYMVMFQVADLAAARHRVEAEAIREVFEVRVEDMEEVHLHPSDVRGAIVSLSAPRPADSWRWGGPGWEQRSSPLSVHGVRIRTDNPDELARRWGAVLDAPLEEVGVHPQSAPGEEGIVEIILAAEREGPPIEIGRVSLVFA